MARLTGQLVRWDDDRGFGFLRIDQSRRELFVHIKSIDMAGRPQLGDRLHFAIGAGSDGRPAAIAVRPEGFVAPARPDRHGGSRSATSDGNLIRAVAASGLLLLLLVDWLLHRAPDWLALTYLFVSALSFVQYWLDKRAAVSGRWRLAEIRLHFTDLFGGIIGGLLAQLLLRHKTAKFSFYAWSYGIAALHASCLLLLLFQVVTLAEL